MKKLTERQAFVTTCYSQHLFLGFDRFWELAQECLGETIINTEFADGKIWERLKESTRNEFEILVGITNEGEENDL